MTKAKVVSLEEWDAMGRELYGGNKEDWAFICPACRLEMSVTRAKAEYPEVEGKGWQPEAECIGRYTDRLSCDWASYGLFKGPLFIRLGPGPTVPIFDFASKPFTGPEGN